MLSERLYTAILLLAIGLCAWLAFHPENADRPIRVPASGSVLDQSFIERSVGKRFIHVPPSLPDGEPNCVAAALRAGGYLPAFAVNGTDLVYDDLLPICFRKKSSSEEPSRGDLGIEYARDVPTMAHMVLFLDNDHIFEKASPSNDEPFRYNSWSLIKRRDRRAGTEFELWAYSPASNCPLDAIAADFNRPDSDTLRGAARAVDRGIFESTWRRTHQFNSLALNALLQENDKQLADLYHSKEKFNFKESFAEYYRISFRSDVYKTLLRTPED